MQTVGPSGFGVFQPPPKPGRTSAAPSAGKAGEAIDRSDSAFWGLCVLKPIVVLKFSGSYPRI